MKKSVILLSFLLFISFFIKPLYSQTVEIGTGSNTVSLPYNPYYGYSYSQSIFEQSEIGLSGTIDKIRFKFNGNSAFTDDPVNVYLAHTSKSTFSSNSDWIDVSLLTLVYSGPVTTVASEVWIEIDISDFAYNNTDNLAVVVHEAQSGYHTADDDFYSSSCSGYKSIYKIQDSPAIDVNNPGTGTQTENRPNIQIVFGSTIPMTYDSSTVLQNNLGDVYVGESDKELACIQIETSGSAPQLTITDFVINMNGSTDPTNDVSNIEIFSTGLNSSFSTSNLFCSASAATGNITISGSETLLTGTNYFWISYDISAGATAGNFVDVECTTVTHNGAKGNETPSVTAPAGSREIKLVPPAYLMNNTSESTCYGTFFDSGGVSSNYTDNESYVKTFCSDNGQNLRFDFTDFNIQHTYDYLRIYDGPNTSSTLIGTYTTEVPVTIISSSTCLTFKFESDVITTSTGWAADFTCFDSGICGVNPDASDLCADAPMLASIDGICGTTGDYNATDLTGTNLQSETCSGLNFINNNSWLRFTASDSEVEIAIICNCPSSGVEVSIFETADCITFVEKGCYDPFYEQAPGVFKATGLTPGNTYYMMVDQFSNPGCDFKINGLTGVLLPIDLVEFKGVCQNENVELSWTTASEINNSFFTLERSEDGRDFKMIAEVDGAGNSHEIINYKYVDNNPDSKSYYYRFKQTDFDGKYSYSNIIYITCNETIIETVSIFPNPFNDYINISFDNNLSEDMKYNIHDCSGRIVQSGILESGQSLYKLDSFESIEKGVYTIFIYNDNMRFGKSLLKI